jgi:acyl-CoA synthetase (AMP-forming)/AMP-acid ligase II
VADAVVVGLPDQGLGEVVGAVVALRGEPPALTDELGAWVRARLATYKAPRRFVVVPEVPRDQVGKADYAAARAAFENA